MFERIKIAFSSIGCKLNRYEIQSISESLRPLGFQTVPFIDNADCYIINTCTVTGRADMSSRHAIRQARRRSINAKIIVTGCYAQMRPEEMGEFGADLVVSNLDKEKLPSIVADLFRERFSAQITQPLTEIDYDLSEFDPTDLTRSFVKIQEGCDERCSFCTIWMARGPVRSRLSKDIIDEINRAVSNEYHEVVLTGVHIGKYAIGEYDISDLLKSILDNSDIARIRLSSLNPLEITEKLMRLMESQSRICPHIHLSLQSGDDEILHAMNRKYSSELIKERILNLVERIPDITIGADFIVGFPGESEEQFENTINLVKTLPFGYLHVFPYSDRPQTEASRMVPKIPSQIKWARSNCLKGIGEEKKMEHIKRFVGRRLNVLLEKEQRGGGILKGFSDNYLRVLVSGERPYEGMLLPVEICEIKGKSLYGIPLIDLH